MKVGTQTQSRTRPAPRAATALALLVLAGGSCRPTQRATEFPDDKPSVEQPILNLFGFEESYIHRINFDVQRRNRLILVHYDRTSAESVRFVDCPVDTQYEYQPSDSKHEETVHIRSLAQLSAQVPMGVARFEAYIKAGSALEFRYATVGAYQVSADPRMTSTDLECAKATHYVATLSVGAFTFRELRSGGGGVSAETLGGANVTIQGGRESGSTKGWGDLTTCDEEDQRGCRTPTQMLLLPLHEAGTAASATTPRATAPRATTTPAERNAIELTVDEQRWRPGHFMATALEKTLSFAQYIDTSTQFGFDGDSIAILGGYLQNEGLSAKRRFKADRTYMIFAAAASEVDIDLVIVDDDGHKLALDDDQDSQPLVTFKPPADGSYRVMIEPGAPEVETFIAVAILNDQGFRVPASLLQGVYQDLLDTGTMASEWVRSQEMGRGLVFQAGQNEWSLVGTLLDPGDKMRLPGINLQGPSVIISRGHDPSLDLDAEVRDEAGRVWADKESDGTPMILVDDPTPGASHSLGLTYVRGEKTTLAASLILRIR